MEIIMSKIVGLMIKMLPSLILKFFLKSESIKKDLEVDFRSVNPFILSLSYSVPSIQLWLRLTNKSPIPIHVDRICFNGQVGQGCFDGLSVRKIILQPKETKDSIYLHCYLSESQKQAISHSRDNNCTRATLNLYLYCQSKIGDFEIDLYKEYFEPKFD